MKCRFTDIRRKEVISACDGCRIGFVDDVIIDTQNARVISLVIYGRGGMLGLFGASEDYIIPWEKIELIGDDIIIISCGVPNPVKRRKKPRFKGKS